MDIKELIKIRDLSDSIANLTVDIGEFVIHLVEDQPDVPDAPKKWADSIYHQADLIQQILDAFKEQVDEKYSDIWQAEVAKLSSHGLPGE